MPAGTPAPADRAGCAPAATSSRPTAGGHRPCPASRLVREGRHAGGQVLRDGTDGIAGTGGEIGGQEAQEGLQRRVSLILRQGMDGDAAILHSKRDPAAIADPESLPDGLGHRRLAFSRDGADLLDHGHASLLGTGQRQCVILTS